MREWQPRNKNFSGNRSWKRLQSTPERMEPLQRLLQMENPGSCSVPRCSFDTSRALCWRLFQKLLSLFTQLLQRLEELDVGRWVNLVFSALILPWLKSATQTPIILTDHGQNWSLWWRILEILEESKLKTFQQVMKRTRRKRKANFLTNPVIPRAQRPQSCRINDFKAGTTQLLDKSAHKAAVKYSLSVERVLWSQHPRLSLWS